MRKFSDIKKNKKFGDIINNKTLVWNIYPRLGFELENLFEETLL